MEPVWTTPRGHQVRLEVRPDTNDWDIGQSIIAENEYRIPPLTGVALDIGAHIGAASVLMLADNPDLHVVAVEPLPANVELLRRNTARFGDRITIIEAAAGTNPVIGWNWRGSESAHRHRFIGNQRFDDATERDSLRVETVTLSELVARFGPISFMKIDAEGAEDAFLDDDAIEQVTLIHGEYHNGARVELRFERPAPRVKQPAVAKKPVRRAPKRVK